MCRVSTYCGCAPLSSGSLTIGVACIILCSIDLLFGFSTIMHIAYENAPELIIVLGVIRIFIDILMIICSGVLLCGVRTCKEGKILCWIVVCAIYCGCMALQCVSLLIVITSVDGVSEKVLLSIILFFDFCILAYLIYGIIVVYNFYRLLKQAIEEMSHP